MRTGALISRIGRQMLRDKRTLALLFAAPLLILTLVHYIFNGGESPAPRLGVAKPDPVLSGMLAKSGIEVVELGPAEAGAGAIRERELDGVLAEENGRWTLTLENDDPSMAKMLQTKVAQAAAALAFLSPAASAEVAAPPAPDTSYLYGSAESGFFDVLGPILIGFFVFFFVFLISGIGLLRERTTGTLERLMSTPVRRGEVLAGYLAGYGLFAVAQTIIVVLYAIGVLEMPLAGSIWNVMAVNVMLALVALSLGTLLSTFASSEFQMMQFIPLVVVPQVFFAGILPYDGMAEWLQALGRIMPLYYAADALKGTMYRGEGFSGISADLLALAAFAAVFIALNVLALKRYRK